MRDRSKTNTFFGAIYDKNGIRPDPSKVEAIKQCPALPTSLICKRC